MDQLLTNHSIYNTGHSSRFAIVFPANLTFVLYERTVEVHSFSVAIEYGLVATCSVEACYWVSGIENDIKYQDCIPNNQLVLDAMREGLRNAGFSEAAIANVTSVPRQHDNIALYNANSLVDEFDAMCDKQYGTH